MCTARDLALATDGKVTVGPETARVCHAAAKRYKSLRSLEGAQVLATAGLSYDYNVIMGNGPMRAYLIDSCMIPVSRISTPIATVFNTSGEMEALARYIARKLETSPEDTFEVHLAASWWHLPRARVLLYCRLNRPHRPSAKVKVHGVPARSYPVFDVRLWKEVTLEPARWLKNILNGNLLWWRNQTSAA